MAEHKGDLDVDGILIARDVRIKRGKHGDILYKHRGEWKKLHIGAAGEVLTVDADGFPSWAPAGGGGAPLAQGTYVGTGVALTQQIALPAIADPKHAIVIGQGGVDGMELFRCEKTKTMQALGGGTYTHDLDVSPALPGPAIGNVVDTLTLIANRLDVTLTANVVGYVYHYSVWG